MRRLFTGLLLLVAAVALAALCLWLLRRQPEVLPTPTTGTPTQALVGATSPPPGTAPAAATAGAAGTVDVPLAPTAPPSPADPFALVSHESLLAYLEELTAIQPYSGWRNSASEGEAEALDYVERKLGELHYLEELGLELERQSFHVFLGTELWETRLELTVAGQPAEVPANGQRGPRDDLTKALRLDSDGALNDSVRDPVVVEGPAVAIRTASDLEGWGHGGLAGKVVLLDYAAVDRVTSKDALATASATLDREPAGVVLVAHFSNLVGESHGAFVGDGNPFDRVEADDLPPVVYARIEDLAPAGIEEWDDLERIEAARIILDADIFSPATSGNLVARIPGADPARAVILSAHIDSPNNPGAMDDGSGSAILLEVARVLDVTHTQPPTDLYLVWYGSEELGLYGSGHFVATHQPLLDRAVAMLQIDCLTRPLDGIDAELTLVSWSYGRLGSAELPWPDHLAQTAARHRVPVVAEDLDQVYSDNSNFSGFDVPNADLIYVDERAMEATGSLHYAAHIHDPYDTVEMARDMRDVLEQMAVVALSAALELPQRESLRVTPRPDQRALFVGSHTEPVHMTPASLIDVGMALAWEGYDVDLIPYGQEISDADLEDTELVIALPVADYPGTDGGAAPYDEAWSEGEIAAIEAYVERGGFLVLTNSAHRLKYGIQALDGNEDWSDANGLSEPFGVTYFDSTVSEAWVQTEGSSPLVSGVEGLVLVGSNAVLFRLTETAQAKVLAQSEEGPVAALVDHGQGRVLALADLGILGMGWGGPDNLRFWQNLARYARQ